MTQGAFHTTRRGRRRSWHPNSYASWTGRYDALAGRYVHAEHDDLDELLQPRRRGARARRQRDLTQEVTRGCTDDRVLRLTWAARVTALADDTMAESGLVPVGFVLAPAVAAAGLEFIGLAEAARRGCS